MIGTLVHGEFTVRVEGSNSPCDDKVFGAEVRNKTRQVDPKCFGSYTFE